MKKKNITTVTISLLCVFLLASCAKTEETEKKEADGKKPEKVEASQAKKIPAKKAFPKRERPEAPKKVEIPAPADVAAPPKDAEKTKSNLASKILKPGTGKDHPKETDKVSVHYSGWTTDGKMFDSSKKRGRPSSFPLNRVIAGWTEGVQLMVEGEERRFWIPEELAYKGRPGRPKGMLVFDIELIEIVK